MAEAARCQVGRVSAPTRIREMVTPDISVVVTLCEHRDMAVRVIEEWTQRHRFPSDCYEVVIVGTGCDAKLEAEVRSRLRHQDRFVHGETKNSAVLYDKGIRAARGRYVFLSESHSLPEPDCLERIKDFLDQNPKCCAAFCRNVGTAKHFVSRMEDRIYREDPLEQADHWNKVTIRGSLLPRDLYLELGGFEAKYGHFAEVALGMKLYASGRRIGLAEEAVVHHFGAERLTELTEALAEYGVAEMRFRAANEFDYWNKYLGVADTWTFQSVLSRPMKWAILRAIVLSATGEDPRRWPMRYLPEHLWQTVSGRRARLLNAWFRVLAARVRFQSWRVVRNVEKAWRAYDDHWQRSIELGRNRGLGGPCARSPRGVEQGEFSIASIDDAMLRGFYPTETSDVGEFRWSHPIAAVALELSPGRYDVELRLCPVRPPDAPVEIKLFLDRTPVSPWLKPGDALGVCQSIEIPGGHDRLRHLVMLAKPFRPRRRGLKDDRDLGIPVQSIGITLSGS